MSDQSRQISACIQNPASRDSVSWSTQRVGPSQSTLCTGAVSTATDCSMGGAPGGISVRPK